MSNMSRTTPDKKRPLNPGTFFVLAYALGALVVSSLFWVAISLILIDDLDIIPMVVLLSIVIATPVGWKLLGAMGYERVPIMGSSER